MEDGGVDSLSTSNETSLNKSAGALSASGTSSAPQRASCWSATAAWSLRAMRAVVAFLRDPDLSRLFERKRGTQPRLVRFNDPAYNGIHKYHSNHISTAHYQLWSFVPVFFTRQLLRTANFYFLVVGVLYLVPAITPVFTAGRYATLGSLAFLIFITGVKEVAEDIKRHREDRRVNNALVEVLRGASDASLDAHEGETVAWKHVRVGDLVVVRRDEGVPSDLVLLATSAEDDMCYVETRAIDGETNLKVKMAAPLDRHLFTPKSWHLLVGEVECEAPNPRLYEFDGHLRVHIPDEDGLPTEQMLECGLTRDHLLPRGVVLRNTDWVVGLVVFTGNETKLMMNLRREAHKVGRVERVITRYIIFLILFQAVVSLILTILFGVFASRNEHRDKFWYLFTSYSGSEVVPRYFTFFLTLSYLVPISLYVTMEIVRGLQSIFIVLDDHMYCAETQTRARCRNSNLNDELGQVTHIFSDKTGTITQNVMEFSRAFVGGEMITERRRQHPGDAEFFRLLALCHTVVPERDVDAHRIEYHASSPDEQALVMAAHRNGVTLLERTSRSILLGEDDQLASYAVLQVLEFSSERKRMSIVVRRPDGRIRLYIKGADSVMFPRMRGSEAPASHQKGDTAAETSSSSLAAPPPVDHSVEAQTLGEARAAVHSFAIGGLRTLVVGYRDLDEDAYQEWAQRYAEATGKLQDRSEALDRLADELEQSLTLLGVSAIVDYLQRDVPDTLRSLFCANIKVWMLTGDKQETAINIGLAAGLLSSDMDIVVMKPGDAADVGAQLDCTEARWRSLEVDGVPSFQNALVVGGDVLDLALSSRLRPRLIRVSERARCVIACRMTPKQKAELVRAMKEENQRAVTLAIGDGANDVGMIQAAHVGVGLAGREGMEASLASDFSVGEFRFLKRLLLVHGRWFYKRNYKLIVFMIYKNAAMAAFSIWYDTISDFSGSQFFDPWVQSMYNLFLTSIPIIVLATLDQEVTAAYALFYPEIYRSGQRNTSGRLRVFLYWFVTALWQSVVMFYLTYYANADGPVGDGQMMGRDMFALVCFTELVLVVHIQLALYQSRWTWFSGLLYFFSATLWFWLGPAYCARTFTADLHLSPMLYWAMMRLLGEPLLWLIIIVTVVICAVPPLLVRHWNRMYLPSPKVIVQELEWVGILHTKRTAHLGEELAAPTEPRFVQFERKRADRHTLHAVPWNFGGGAFAQDDRAARTHSRSRSRLPSLETATSAGGTPAGVRERALSSNIRQRRRRFYSSDISTVDLDELWTTRGARSDTHVTLESPPPSATSLPRPDP